MDIQKARDAVALQDKLDCCAAHLAKLADADSIKTKNRVHFKNEKGEDVSEERDVEQPMIVRKLVISTPDGGSERILELELTPEETKAILAPVRETLMARQKQHTADLDAL